MTELSTAEGFAGQMQDLESALGVTFGPSEPLEIDQQRIQSFADATNDHQWIHIDLERAESGPFGTTIAHGYLTLSLVPHFLAELFDVRGSGMGVNYGLNKVRFPAPLRSGARVTATVTARQLQRSAAGARVTLDVVVEADGESKPVCVAQVVVFYAAAT